MKFCTICIVWCSQHCDRRLRQSWQQCDIRSRLSFILLLLGRHCAPSTTRNDPGILSPVCCGPAWLWKESKTYQLPLHTCRSHRHASKVQSWILKQVLVHTFCYIPLLLSISMLLGGSLYLFSLQLGKWDPIQILPQWRKMYMWVLIELLGFHLLLLS